MDTINQENICGLNTLIILTMLAQQRGELVSLVERLRTEGTLVQSLLSLLRFWHSHYRTRGKDCHSLEQFSRIPFSDWRLYVSRLTTTLAHPSQTQL